MKKISIFCLIVFLLISTSIIKNSTKKIEQQIYNTKENIRILNNQYEIVKLDQEKHEYVLDWQGPGYIKVLVNCIEGHGDPEI